MVETHLFLCKICNKEVTGRFWNTKDIAIVPATGAILTCCEEPMKLIRQVS